jgi:hypothetical protein
MKKTLLILMAALSLTIAAQAQKKYPHWPLDDWLLDRTIVGLQLGDKEAAKPAIWYPYGEGTFAGDWIHQSYLSLVGYGTSRSPLGSHETIYIRQLAYVESARVRLGGRPFYRYEWPADIDQIFEKEYRNRHVRFVEDD